MGVYSYQQYTNGSVLTRATRDINQYFPQRAFTASWVFVTTWDFVQTRNTSVFNRHSAPVNHFLIFSFQTQGGRLYRPSIIRVSFLFFFPGNQISSGVNFRRWIFFYSDELWRLCCHIFSSGGKTNITG